MIEWGGGGGREGGIGRRQRTDDADHPRTVAGEWDLDENEVAHIWLTNNRESFAFYRRVNGVAGHIGRVYTEYTCFSF